MAAMKEWECPVHGDFDCTHPLCPHVGCETEVKQVFRTPVTIGSQLRKRFDAGIKKSVDMMGLGNLRSSRAGEASYGGNTGDQVLWGNDVERVLGVSINQLTATAARPLNVTYKDGRKETIETSVMRELAAEGATSHRLPRPAELTRDPKDRGRMPR
jgi:hypothetical protein